MGSATTYVSYNDIYEYDLTNYYTTGEYDVNFAGESALTSAIDYVTSEDLPKVYALTGHGEGELSAAFQNAVEKENIDLAELCSAHRGGRTGGCGLRAHLCSSDRHLPG